MKQKSEPRVWTIKTYDRLSRYYDALMRIFFPLGQEGREKIVEKLDSGTVLDVACGTGTLLAMAEKKGLKCTGIDLSEEMLAQASRKVPGAEFRQASYYKIPYPDESFDYVVATNALSGAHIDARKVLGEMLRVCKKGGRVYIAEWPKAEKETFAERLLVWFADLNDDAPKDYLEIFREMEYEPEIAALRKRYYVFGIRK
jgi:ubiquinone/menaquinone biosynthesis C-methylase UbiE